jgi:hypothetical protein
MCLVLAALAIIDYFLDKKEKKEYNTVINQLQYNNLQKDTIIDLLEQISFKKDSICKVTHTKN